MRILIIEDDQSLAQTLKTFLEKRGFAADYVNDGEAGEKRLELYHKDYDLVILDRLLPQRSGDEILQTLRSKNISIPVLMLTAKIDLSDKISGLEKGADDYLGKPFDHEELLARIRALLRRPEKLTPARLNIKGITLDAGSRKVFRGEKEIKFTPKEFALLEFLMRNPGRALNREEIFNHVWDFLDNSLSNIIDVHMHSIRRKLGRDRGQEVIETVPGIGYRLNVKI